MYDDTIAKCETQQIGAGGLLRSQTLRENLANQKQRAEAEVKRLTELIGLLDENPNTQRILELLGMNHKF